MNAGPSGDEKNSDSSSAPFLILYFDVNQTIVMSDAAQNRPVTAVLDKVLGTTTYGT